MRSPIFGLSIFVAALLSTMLPLVGFHPNSGLVACPALLALFGAWLYYVNKS